MKLISKISAVIKRIQRNIFLDKHVKNFINHNVEVWEKKKINSDSQILVEYSNSTDNIITWSYFANYLAQQYNASICTFALPVSVPDKALDRIYQSFNVQKKIIEKLTAEQQLEADRIFEQEWKKIKTKQDLFDYKLNGISLGIDIYETYLRAGKATIYFEDKDLKKFFKLGIELLIFWEDYFSKNTVKATIISHECYLFSGVLWKIASKYNVPNYCVTCTGMYLQKESFDYYKRFKNYREIFNSLSDEQKKVGLEFAKRQLKARFSGVVGVDMLDSTKSAFTEIKTEPILEKNDKLKVLICSHCFYDNPHFYGGLLFLDFYEWLCFLGEISECTDYDWYIKIHPDYMEGTLQIIQSIAKKYPKFKLLSPSVSHLQLAKEGINIVLTGYGTVGCEYPLLDIPVINAGYNPHIAYNFNIHPQSIEEYKEILTNLNAINLNINKDEVYEFYCVHKTYANRFKYDDMIFKSRAEEFRTVKDDLSPLAYEYFLQEYSVPRHKEILQNIDRIFEKTNQLREYSVT